MPVRIFLHGLESSNKGTKSVFFREKYPDMILPNLMGGIQERMEKLYEILDGKNEIIFVGSSYGGLMASIFSIENEARVKRLILLAPAISLKEFSEYQSSELSVPVKIFHGRGDAVIPLFDVERVARRCFKNLEFNSVDDDHFLHKTFKMMDWDNLLYK